MDRRYIETGFIRSIQRNQPKNADSKQWIVYYNGLISL